MAGTFESEEVQLIRGQSLYLTDWYRDRGLEDKADAVTVLGLLSVGVELPLIYGSGSGYGSGYGNGYGSGSGSGYGSGYGNGSGSGYGNGKSRPDWRYGAKHKPGEQR